METLEFWQRKLLQFFHDPPGKPFYAYVRSKWFQELVTDLTSPEAWERIQARRKKREIKGHQVASAALFEALLSLPQAEVEGPPDWAAAGADRPQLYGPWGTRPVSPKWTSRPLVTHPLHAGALLAVHDLTAAGDDNERREVGRAALERPFKLPGDLRLGADGWQDPARLQPTFVALWRRFRDALAQEPRDDRGRLLGSPLWEEMPADTRCPDHSIWDHLKVTTALAFLPDHGFADREWQGRDEGARQPWLLRMSLGPVQEFIAEARTGRDLWLGSFLLADLAWHAMEPFVERYGPDCILYPDLRGNPRADCWLHGEYPGALPPGLNPGTFAAVLPNAFVALVPRGGEGGLPPLEGLAREGQDRVKRRWGELAGTVRVWLTRVAKEGAWQETWDRQHRQPPLYCVWNAVPWLPPGALTNAHSLRGRALPAQRADFREPAEPEARARRAADRQVDSARADRLRPWVPAEVWTRYELAREVYALGNLGVFQAERGFDYALTHHQLGVRHALRKASDLAPVGDEEPGEKCTQCGNRTALGGEPGKVDTWGGLKQRVRDFWRPKELDPDERGAERLCGVCALKRFLVEADQDPGRKRIGLFNLLWAGMGSGFEDVADGSTKREVRVPFPSTATLAAQGFLEAAVTDRELRPYLQDVVSACRETGLPRTSFPRALPRLARLHRPGERDDAASAFLEYEAEDTLFPETADGRLHLLPPERAGEKPRIKRLKKAVAELRKAARERGIPAPGRRIAVIRMDGDRMGHLLLGDAQAIGATWRDVLHPDLPGQIGPDHALARAGWPDLLDTRRLMGPSLHAFVSRALAGFAHRIVPWVVEREFSGRLIYAGGDELLCLAPADEAIALAARLQQLFSAPWVVDTAARADEDPWAWRKKGWRDEEGGAAEPGSGGAGFQRYGSLQDRARARFVVPRVGRDVEGNTRPVTLPVTDPEDLEGHPAEDPGWRPPSGAQGPLQPMLGRHASLSAGIAIGHFKTPLGGLIQRAGGLLKRAKAPYGPAEEPPTAWQGRAALGIGHGSRGGAKTEVVLPWRLGGEGKDLDRVLAGAIEGFGKGLPGRLPYKLRGFAGLVAAALEEERDAGLRSRLLKGLFRSALDDPDARGRSEAEILWSSAIELFPHHPERHADALLLCRALAGDGEVEEGE